jgi:hypothetical protein
MALTPRSTLSMERCRPLEPPHQCCLLQYLQFHRRRRHHTWPKSARSRKVKLATRQLGVKLLSSWNALPFVWLGRHSWNELTRKRAGIWICRAIRCTVNSERGLSNKTLSLYHTDLWSATACRRFVTAHLSGTMRRDKAMAGRRTPKLSPCSLPCTLSIDARFFRNGR